MQSPVLFLIFKRPNTTKRVFERIREAQPPRLYIAADGPRKDRPEEVLKCSLTRQIVDNIDWSCEVYRLYRDSNLGCGKGVSSAITWFFEHEEQGIIIEDDILPHIDFFKYCDEMLDLYKNDERIQGISGHNVFYNEIKANKSYYLSNYSGIWGWASWRRVWETYIFNTGEINRDMLKMKLDNRVPSKTCSFFLNVYDKMLDKGIDTWDYQFFFNQIMNDRYFIIPYINMTRNIGFDSIEATHTSSSDNREILHVEKSPYPMMHPAELAVDGYADKVRINNSHFYNRSLLLRIIGRLFH